MALDLYAGTLTRYWRGDWENAGARQAREQGLSYVRIDAGAAGEQEAPASAEEIRSVVLDWRGAISAALEKSGIAPLDWDESDGRPYFTDRPQWDAYGALKLWAAYAEHTDLTPPAVLPENWPDDPALQRCETQEKKPRFHNIVLPEWWLPMEFGGVFKAPTPTSGDEKKTIGSLDTLAEHLDALEASGAAPFDGLARFGLETFRGVVKQAVAHRLPLLLDY